MIDDESYPGAWQDHFAKMPGQSFVIELPWPPKELNPNFKRRKHWSVYRPHTKVYRDACYILTIAARARVPLEGAVPVTIDFYPPDRRHRDDDNMISAFKAGRDGVADALGINDRRLAPVYRFNDPVKGGKIVVRI